jgi:hypothetical protein
MDSLTTAEAKAQRPKPRALREDHDDMGSENFGDDDFVIQFI